MLSHGYQLYRPEPVTEPEVYVNGVPMSSIALWGDLRTSTRPVGDWDASWQIIRTPGRRIQRHPAFFYGADVVVRDGPIPVWVGSLVEPDWDSGELTAIGSPREAEGAQCLTAAITTTTKVNLAVDQGIARGALNWTRRSNFTNTPVGAADGTEERFEDVAALLDAWAEENKSGWRINRSRQLVISPTSEANPIWYVTPDVGELGAADDERVDRVFVAFYDSGAAGAVAYTSYPAATPAGGIEKGVSVVKYGPMTATRATGIAEGIWSKLAGRSGWLNGLQVDRNQLATEGDLPANLAFVRAGDAMRLLGVPDARGMDFHTDVVIGETVLDWAEGTLQLNPVGLAPATFEAAIEAIVPGAVPLS